MNSSINALSADFQMVDPEAIRNFQDAARDMSVKTLLESALRASTDVSEAAINRSEPANDIERYQVQVLSLLARVYMEEIASRAA